MILDAEQAAAALALAREILHSVEQFVISTPDLDTDRFLQRVRGTAAGLVPDVDASTLRLQAAWARKALGTFGSLQRRYVGERDEEMWRLLDVYAQTLTSGRARGSELVQTLRESHQRIRSMASLPDLRAAREQFEAEVKQAQKLVEQKVREDRERVAGLARQVAQMESALQSVRGLANFDVLTGILHRGALLQALRELVATGTPCALALMDLDSFKTINDSLGHAVADRLLVAVSEHLQRVARTTDILGRFGGDEFCFVAPGFTGEQLANRLAGPVAKRHMRLELDDRVCSVLLSLSVGIAVCRKGEGSESLLSRADQVLLSVKQGGKGGIRMAAH